MPKGFRSPKQKRAVAAMLVRRNIKNRHDVVFQHPRTVLRTLQEAGKSHSNVRMQYIPTYDESLHTYIVEPYEIKVKNNKVYFYAFHPTHGSIHSFLTPRIVSVQPVETGFDPKWPIKMRKRKGLLT